MGKPRQRGLGEGSIYQRKDGKWTCAVTVGWNDGKQVRRVFYGKTRSEVKAKLTKAQHELEQGSLLPPDRETIATYLPRWLEETAKPTLRASTYRSYHLIVHRHLIPSLGAIKLTKLTPQHVQRYMNSKQTEGLSARTVTYHRAVLRRALNIALRWQLVNRNVATLVDPPKRDAQVRRFLGPEEARAFLEMVRGDRLEALYTVALAVGLRQGEALGLSWNDVDLDARQLHVRRALQRVKGELQLVEPKTIQSRRSIPIPVTAASALRAHYKRQIEERLAAGPDWEDHGLVFTTLHGKPLDARNVTRQFHRHRISAGLPWLRFHDLRHGCASLLLAQKVNPRVVQEVLGHSQISLTLGTYSHVIQTVEREAMDKIDEVFVGVGSA